jgi:hypothetical protein
MEQVITEQKITESNELIAIFMGYERYEDSGGIWFKKEGMIICMHPKLEDLKYHSSWDWLMPVVEKISTIHYPDYYSHSPKREDDGDFDDCAYPRTFGMRDKEGNYMVRINASVLITAPTFIGAVYEAVIDFVKDYGEWNTGKQ